MMDEPQFQDWVAMMLQGNDIHAARIRVGKAEVSVDEAQDKIGEVRQILDSSSSLAEARQKAIAAGLLPKK